MLVTGLRSISSRVITLMLAGASLIHCWAPVAVTTTVSICLAEAASALASAWACALRARPMARARALPERWEAREGEGNNIDAVLLG